MNRISNRLTKVEAADISNFDDEQKQLYNCLVNKGYDENKVFRIIDGYEYDVLPADPKEFISTYIQEFDEYLLNDIKDFIRKNGLPSVQCEINDEIFTFPDLRPLK